MTDFGDPLLLEKIDGLFACGVGDHVSLPQLLVVGNQSSGKSSVLEGLTSLPFPRDSGLCTRFATWILFRRDPKFSISAAILKRPDKGAETVTELKTPDSLTATDFEGIMVQVCTTCPTQAHADTLGSCYHGAFDGPSRSR